jgi:hypothetical protein
MCDPRLYDWHGDSARSEVTRLIYTDFMRVMGSLYVTLYSNCRVLSNTERQRRYWVMKVCSLMWSSLRLTCRLVSGATKRTLRDLAAGTGEAKRSFYDNVCVRRASHRSQGA